MDHNTLEYLDNDGFKLLKEEDNYISTTGITEHQKCCVYFNEANKNFKFIVIEKYGGLNGSSFDKNNIEEYTIEEFKDFISQHFFNEINKIITMNKLDKELPEKNEQSKQKIKI